MADIALQPRAAKRQIREATAWDQLRTNRNWLGFWFMLPAMAAGDFYILCPDNDVTRALDERRILWAAQDMILNRPALSRWHPDFKLAFADFAEAGRR